jgi:hypothetical protein
MPDSCTCGAQLPPDALFCHKCGKPQREVGPEEPAAFIPVLPEAIRTASAAPPPLAVPTFRNPVAVRVAVLAGAISLPLCWIPVLSLGVWIGCGALSVYFYRRRTGQPMDWRSGLRMGWMTGVVVFAILTVLFTVGIAFISAAGGPSALSQPQFRNMPMYDEKSIEALKSMMTFSGIIQGLLATFISTTVFCGAGGAIGARLIGRD